MKNLTTNFIPYDEPAEPTSRLLDGSSDHGMAEEWVEYGTINGKPAQRFFIFAKNDIVWDDGEPRLVEDYPWDDEHISRTEII